MPLDPLPLTIPTYSLAAPYSLYIETITIEKHSVLFQADNISLLTLMMAIFSSHFFADCYNLSGHIKKIHG